VSNLVYAAPFLSLFLIHAFVGEEILPSTVAGLVLIVAGVIIQQYASRRNGK
jgi:drug/metabolite transporter (DMT)-like permease